MNLKKIPWRNVGLWALQILFAFIYFNVGRMKLTQREGWAKAFHEWGYPDHFYLVIGVLEVLGGLALLHPRTVFYGASTLSVIMVGACATHVIHGPRGQAIFTGIVTVVFALLAWARRPAWIRAGPARAPTSSS